MTASPAAQAVPQLDAHARRLASILTLGAVLPLLDATIITVAVGDIAQSLDSTLSVVQWTITGYALAAAVAIPLSAWLTTRFGAKSIWLGALSIFLLGSVLCAISWNATAIIVFRVLQGFGGGLLMPSLQTVLVSTVGPALAKPAMTKVGIPAVLAPIFGPVVGGILVDQLDWRWIFYINIPICIAALILSAKYISDPTERRRVALDWRGLLLAVPGMVLTIFGLDRLPDDAHAPIYLISGIMLLALYCWYALRTKIEALVNIRLLAGKNFSGSILLLLLSSVVFYAGILIVPLYLQEVRSLSAMQAGLTVGIQGIGALIARRAGTRIGAKLDPRALIAVAVIAATAGTLPFTQPNLVNHEAMLYASLLVRGAGIGLITILAMGTAYEYLPKADVPQASLISRLITQVGASFGAVLVVALLHSYTAGSSTEAGAYGNAFGWLTVGTVLCLIPIAAIGRPGTFVRSHDADATSTSGAPDR